VGSYGHNRFLPFLIKQMRAILLFWAKTNYHNIYSDIKLSFYEHIDSLLSKCVQWVAWDKSIVCENYEIYPEYTSHFTTIPYDSNVPYSVLRVTSTVFCMFEGSQIHLSSQKCFLKIYLSASNQFMSWMSRAFWGLLHPLNLAEDVQYWRS
jgi:hypothetical protein